MMNKSLLLMLSFLISLASWASPITVDVISAPQGLTIQNGSASLTFPTGYVTESVLTQGYNVPVTSSYIQKQARGIYDFNISGGAALANIALGLNLPNKAIITKAYVDVTSQPVSGGNIGKIQISCASPGDIVPATSANVFVSGTRVAGTPAGTTSTFIKLTGATGCYVNITNGATAALLSGQFSVFVDYAISQ